MSEYRKSIGNQVKHFLSIRPKYERHELDERLTQVLDEVFEFYRTTQNALNGPALTKEFKEASGSRNRNYEQLQQDIGRMHEMYSKAIDEDRRVVQLERRLALQAMFFRVCTTLLVGAVILGLYWVANEFGIPLPLLSKSLNGPI